MLTIPQIRERLHELARELNCPELSELAEGTKRRFFGRKAPVSQRPITQIMVDEIRAYHAAHPTVHQREIAGHWGIDQGRVNEILHGYRDGSPFIVR